MGPGVAAASVSVCDCASFSSTPADIAAAQASPEKGTEGSSSLCSSVDTPTDFASAASTNSIEGGGGFHSGDCVLFAGGLPWKAASRQSGTPCDGEVLSESPMLSNALGLHEDRGVSSSSSSISSSAPQFLSADNSDFAFGRNAASSSTSVVPSRLPNATGL